MVCAAPPASPPLAGTARKSREQRLPARSGYFSCMIWTVVSSRECLDRKKHTQPHTPTPITPHNTAQHNNTTYEVPHVRMLGIPSHSPSLPPPPLRSLSLSPPYSYSYTVCKNTRTASPITKRSGRQQLPHRLPHSPPPSLPVLSPGLPRHCPPPSLYPAHPCTQHRRTHTSTHTAG